MEKISKLPLKRLGYIVQWHEERAERGEKLERVRHKRIALEMRKTITAIFLQRMNSGEYDETISEAA